MTELYYAVPNTGGSISHGGAGATITALDVGGTGVFIYNYGTGYTKFYANG